MSELEQKALEALIEAVKGAPEGSAKKSQKFALALRRILVGWLIEEKPYFVQSASKEGVLCYGDLRLCRLADHRVVLLGPKGPLNVGAAGIKDCAFILMKEATDKLRAAYCTRLRAQMKVLWEQLGGMHPELATNLALQQDMTNSYVEWITEGSMEPRWWGRAARDELLRKLLLKHAWDYQIFDKEIWGLAIRVCGPSPTLASYNQIAFSREAVRSRIQETPNLAPLLMSRVPGYSGADTVLEADNQALARVRDRFLSAGCTPAGWRWLTRQPRQWVYDLHQHLAPKEAAVVLNELAALQVGRLPVRFIRVAVLKRWFCPETAYLGGKLTNEQKVKSIAHFLRITVDAVRSRKVRASTVRDRAIEILDFVKDGNPVLKGATWQSLLRRQEEWHRDQHRARVEEIKARRAYMPAYAWTPLVPEVAYKDVKAISLTTSDELWDEGDYLEHCVGTYANDCFTNQSRIFSMRDQNNTSLATLEVTYNEGRWNIAQLRGRRNQEVSDTTLKKLAQKVVSAARQAPKLNPSANRVLREQQRRPRPAQQPANAQNNAFDELDNIPF